MEQNDIKVFQALNAAMQFFKEGCGKRKLSPTQGDWRGPIEPKETSGIFAFNYRKSLPSSRSLLKLSEKKFEKFYAGFSENKARFWIDLNGIFKQLLDLRNHTGFMAELIHIIWPQQGITKEQFEDLINKYRTPHAKEIQGALWSWVYASNFKKSTKYGGAIHKYLQDIPDQLKETSSNTLYRAIKIDQSLFDKLQVGRKKSLELKDRTYSSWSYSEAAAQDFGSRFGHEASQQGQIVVILRKRFKPDEIMLNVEKAAKYYGLETSYAEEEGEIIVRVSHLTFTFKDIYKYLVKGLWHTNIATKLEKEQS